MSATTPSPSPLFAQDALARPRAGRTGAVLVALVHGVGLWLLVQATSGFETAAMALQPLSAEWVTTPPAPEPPAPRLPRPTTPQAPLLSLPTAELARVAELQRAYALAAGAGVLIAAARGVARWHPTEPPAMLPWPEAMALDNHWVRLDA